MTCQRVADIPAHFAEQGQIRELLVGPAGSQRVGEIQRWVQAEIGVGVVVDPRHRLKEIEVQIVLQIERARNPIDGSFALGNQPDFLGERVTRLVADDGRDNARIAEVVLRDIGAQKPG